MSAGQLAALIAAVFFAALACVGMFVLIRLAGLMSAATSLVADYRHKSDQLFEQAQAAVDRTHEQLARTDAITASMDEVTANMAELSGHVSTLSGLAKGISGAVSTPLTGAAALAYGLRRALLVRRSLQVTALTEPPQRATVLADRPAGLADRPVVPGRPAELSAISARRPAGR